MIPILDNAVLTTNLDCQNYDLKNIGMLEPVPDGLVAIDDPRLTSGRTPAPGSVTNDIVNVAAFIDQSKLNLNGVMPSTWLVASPIFSVDILSTRATAGSAAEFLSSKNVINGYAGLDVNGKVLSSNAIAGAAVGTVNSVGLSVPDPFRTTGTNPIVTSGTLTVEWKNAPASSWFGSDGSTGPPPHEFIYPFYVTDPFSRDLFSLPASKFTTGVFSRARLPIAHGVGTGHAMGMVPDPGNSGDGNMYLGRDMEWHYFVVNDPGLAYQPRVPDVTIVLDWWDTEEIWVTVRSTLKKSFLFYRQTPYGGTPPAFVEAHHDKTPDDAHITFKVNEHDFIEAYASKAGYTTSDVEQWEVITPITDLGL